MQRSCRQLQHLVAVQASVAGALAARPCASYTGAPPAIFGPQGRPQGHAQAPGPAAWPPYGVHIFWDADNLAYTRANYNAIMEAVHPWRMRSLDIFCGLSQLESLRNSMLKRPLSSFAPGGPRANEDVHSWRLPPGGVLHVPMHSGMHPEKTLTDMQLAVAAMAALHSAPPSLAVLVTGDQDYVPLVTELKRRGHTVVVVGAQEISSGELLSTADATMLLQRSGGGRILAWNGVEALKPGSPESGGGTGGEGPDGSGRARKERGRSGPGTEESWWRRLLWGESAATRGGPARAPAQMSNGPFASISPQERHSAPASSWSRFFWGAPAARRAAKPPGRAPAKGSHRKRGGAALPAHSSRRSRAAADATKVEPAPSAWAALSRLLFRGDDAHMSAAARSGAAGPSSGGSGEAAAREHKATQVTGPAAPPDTAASVETQKAAAPPPLPSSKASPAVADGKGGGNGKAASNEAGAKEASSKESGGKDGAKATQGKPKKGSESAQGTGAKKDAPSGARGYCRCAAASLDGGVAVSGNVMTIAEAAGGGTSARQLNVAARRARGRRKR